MKNNLLLNQYDNESIKAYFSFVENKYIFNNIKYLQLLLIYTELFL